jgi:hypothetical protein
MITGDEYLNMQALIAQLEEQRDRLNEAIAV